MKFVRKVRLDTKFSVQHPALMDFPLILPPQDSLTVLEKSVKSLKRQLYRLHVTSLPLLLPLDTRPVATKTVKLKGVNIRKEIDSVIKDFMQQEGLELSQSFSSTSTSSLQSHFQQESSFPLTQSDNYDHMSNCYVKLERLTNQELMKSYGKLANSSLNQESNDFKLPKPLKDEDSEGIKMDSSAFERVPNCLPNCHLGLQKMTAIFKTLHKPARLIMPKCSVLIKRLTREMLMKFCSKSADLSPVPLQSSDVTISSESRMLNCSVVLQRLPSEAMNK